MKCDELKEDYSYDATDDNTKAVYLKSDVDEAIAELKAENERLEKFAQYLKDDANKIRDYAQSLEKEHRLTKRALWMARAMRAKDCANKILRDAGIMFAISHSKELDKLNTLQKKWQRVEDKCLHKAEEYK